MNEKYIPENLPVAGEEQETVATLRAKIEAINKREDGRVFKVPTEADDFAVNVLEQRIRDIESKERSNILREKTASLRERIDEINRQSSRTHGERRDADEAEVLRLEDEIRILEGSGKEKKEVVTDEEENLDLTLNDEPISPDPDQPQTEVPVPPDPAKVVDREFLINTLRGDNGPELPSEEGVPPGGNENMVGAEGIDQRAEYLRLKRASREAEEEFHQTLTDRGVLGNVSQKLFGVGRNELSPEAQVAYAKSVEAANAFKRFGLESGIYQEIIDYKNQRLRERAERENPNGSEEFFNRNRYTLEGVTVNRHYSRVSDRQNEAQTARMPEALRGSKRWLVDLIKNNRGVALGVGTLAVAALIGAAPLAAASMVATGGVGFAARYITGKAGERMFVRSKEADVAGIEDSARNDFSEDIFGDINPEVLARLTASKNRLKITRTAVRNTATALGIGAGLGTGIGINELGGFDSLKDIIASPDSNGVGPDFNNLDVPINPDATGAGLDNGIPDSGSVDSVDTAVDGGLDIPSPEAISKFPAFHEVVKGDTTSEILFDALKERLNAGEIELPKGVTMDNLSHKMYQTFPEMTDASGVSPKLSPGDWVKLGVDSGDPHIIMPGENINVEALVKIMEGTPVKDVMANLDNLAQIPNGVPDLAASAIDAQAPDITPDISSVTPGDVVAPGSGDGNVSNIMTDEQVAWAGSIFNGDTGVEVGKDAGNVSNIMTDEQVAWAGGIFGGETGAEVAGDGGGLKPDGAIPTAEPISNNAEATSGGPETTSGEASGTPFEVDGWYEMTEKYSKMETDLSTLKEGEGVSEYLSELLRKAAYDERAIMMPVSESNMYIVNNINYSGDIPGLTQARLLDLKVPLETHPEITSDKIWRALGMGSGDSSVINPTDKLRTGELLKFIISGNKEDLLTKLGLI